MTRRKVGILISIAAAVIVFDIWFFWNPSGPSAGMTDDGEEDPWSPSDLLAFAVARGAGGASDTPWRDRESWPLVQRETPLDGELARELMVTRSVYVAPPMRGEATEVAPASIGGALPRLSVVLWDEVAPVAVLDTRVVQVGDVLDGYRIEQIAPEQVLVSRGGARHWLPLVAAATAVPTEMTPTNPAGEQPPSEANP